MLRARTFLKLAVGVTDSVSGYGACYPVSPEIKAFFEGWMGENCPTDSAWNDDLKADAVNHYAQQRQCVLAFADALETMANELRKECE